MGPGAGGASDVTRLDTVDPMRRELFDEEHKLFRASFRRFVEKEMVRRVQQGSCQG